MNRKLSIFMLLFGLFVVSLFVGGETKSASVEKDVFSASVGGDGLDVYYFYGEGCSHCANVEPFLAEMEQKYPLRLHKSDIYTNRSCITLFGEYSRTYGLPVERKAIPAIFVSDTYLVGDTQILEDLEEILEKALQEENSTVNQISGVDNSANVGPVSVAGDISILTVTAAALVDSISPCSIAILVFLIGSRVLVSNQKKRALKVGLAFCLSVFIAYFLFGLGLFTVVQVSGFSSLFSLLVGFIAVLAGVLYLKDVFWSDRGGFKMEVPNSLKPLLMKMLKSVTTPIGAFAMGFVVCLFELPCTGGPYLFILGQLANTATRIQAIPLLLYYNFIFVLPLVIISMLLYSNIFSVGKARAWSDKNKRLLKMIGGFMMMALGFMVMPVPLVLQSVQMFLSIFRAVSPPYLAIMSVFLVASLPKRKRLSRVTLSYGCAFLLLAPLVVMPSSLPSLILASPKQQYMSEGKIQAVGGNGPSSLDSKIDDSLGSGKLVFLFFYMDGCGWCKKQKPVVDELERKYSEYVVFIRVNGKENVKAKERFGVNSYPNMFLLHGKDEMGFMYEHFRGFTEFDALQEALANELGFIPVPTYLLDVQTNVISETHNSTEENQNTTITRSEQDSSIVLFSLIDISIAQAGSATIKVQYQDACPRGNADVLITWCAPKPCTTPTCGRTDESGLTTCDNLNPNTIYQVEAYWPDYQPQYQFGPTVGFETDDNGDATVSITNSSNYPDETESCGSGDCSGYRICVGDPKYIQCDSWDTECDTTECCRCDGGTRANPSSRENACTACVTTEPNNQEGILHLVNVTAFKDSSVITSGISNISGMVTLTNLPYGNLTLVAYGKSDYSQVIGNVTVFIDDLPFEAQNFDVICDQNYSDVTNNWEIIVEVLSLSMFIIALPLFTLSSRIRIKKYGREMT